MVLRARERHLKGAEHRIIPSVGEQEDTKMISMRDLQKYLLLGFADARTCCFIHHRGCSAAATSAFQDWLVREWVRTFAFCNCRSEK
ncbi:hypothetical protein Taro_012428 [Colocasia esculenta]|uniref:Uncharacterized protein n=1 Tax=Colocasia esculenta TaxID=4460 RepID=A0A843UCZ9_COLES|nr:hypothetical protein [Colocasia esculenta]